MRRLTLKSSEIDHCPFCGDRKTELFRAHGEESLKPHWFVWCTECGCSGARSNNKKTAIATWNRRAPAGLINRKMDCPNCGPKFRKAQAKFLREVERLLAKEKRKPSGN